MTVRGFSLHEVLPAALPGGFCSSPLMGKKKRLRDANLACVDTQKTGGAEKKHRGETLEPEALTTLPPCPHHQRGVAPMVGLFPGPWGHTRTP